MPTEQDFNATIQPWIEQGIPQAAFQTLRQTFLTYLKKQQEIAAQGVLGCIACFHSPAELQAFLHKASFYCTLQIPLRFQHNPVEANFFNFTGYFTLDTCLCEIIATMEALPALPLADGQASMVLASVIMNVSENLLYDQGQFPLSDDLQILMSSRARSLRNFLEHVSYCGLSAYRLELTGSDPHIGGQQTLLLQTDNQSRLVFKPRNMTAEQLLFSSVGPIPSLFQRINYHLPPAYQLTLLPVYADASTWYGTEGFLQKLASLTPQQAQDHYTKMGELLFLCTLFGCTDLHQDNLLPTANGPMILDGECSFLLYKMQERSLNSSLIMQAVNFPSNPNIFGEPALSSFTIHGSFSQKQAQDAFWDGFSQLQTLCQAPEVQEELWEFFLQVLNQQPCIRTLPFDTLELRGMVSSYYANPTAVLQYISDQIDERTQSWNLFYDSVALSEALTQGFQQGDIPIFQLLLDTDVSSTFLVNGIQVGHCNAYLDQDKIAREIFRPLIQYLLQISRDNMPKIELI